MMVTMKEKQQQNWNFKRERELKVAEAAQVQKTFYQPLRNFLRSAG